MDPRNPGTRIRGNLAAMSAERVFPIFENWEYPREDEFYFGIPEEMLQMAKLVIEGKGDLKQAEIMDSDAYINLNHWFEETREEIPEYPVNTLFAGIAAWCALSEAIGWNTFDVLDEHQKQKWLQAPDETELALKGRYAFVPYVTDEELIYRKADAAGTAAVAYACSPLSVRCSSERLEEFWTWWLMKGLPESWELVAGNTPK